MPAQFANPQININGLVTVLDGIDPMSITASSTTWNDLSFYNNNGTLLGGAYYTSSGLGAVFFDGSDDRVYINNSDSINFSSSQQYTVMAMIYPYGGGTTWHGIFSKGNNQQYALTINSAGAYLHYETNQSGYTALDSTPGDIVYNTWQHVAIRYDGSTKTIWRNGVIVATQVAPGLTSTSNTEELRLGEGNNGESYRGLISAFHNYNRALSSLEINETFNALRTRYGI
jgi:hypothetical protein